MRILPSKLEKKKLKEIWNQKYTTGKFIERCNFSLQKVPLSRFEPVFCHLTHEFAKGLSLEEEERNFKILSHSRVVNTAFPSTFGTQVI